MSENEFIVTDIHSDHTSANKCKINKWTDEDKQEVTELITVYTLCPEKSNPLDNVR